MAKMLCKTKGNTTPKGKPRIYFTCHPEDFDRYFNKICEDIYKTSDCAIFYTEDMDSVIDEQDKATDLESNNLFVVPVTFRLLSQSNRAMDFDIPFALERHIPVLPFMMETGIDIFYSKKFGELQYLKPYSTDLTEVSYEEKLKKYLESVLISDEMAERVRAAFGAYIFLSYRKKDRRYANELMHLIHSYPECRDIAVWYDEFLTPGESFRENIEKMLLNSKLFTLLVTPNLLEEPDGRPNYVMREEYPTAKNFGIDILPAEMEETDIGNLCEKFEGIPQCINPSDESFRIRLLESLSKIATTANDNDPMHNFLIGLAYFEGIDVEVDRQRGLELIISAGESNLPEAMKKLYYVYYNDNDFKKAVFWAGRLVDYYRKQNGDKHSRTLLWMSYQALANIAINQDKVKSVELAERVYAIRCEINGDEHPDTIASLAHLAFAYSCTNLVFGSPKALKAYKKVYALHVEKFGEESAAALTALENLASAYRKQKNFQEVLGRYTDGDVLPCGMDSVDFYRLAAEYETCGKFVDPLLIYKKIYTSRVSLLGKSHEDTLRALKHLASAYRSNGDISKALELYERLYELLCKIWGANHPCALAVWEDVLLLRSRNTEGGSAH